MVGNSWKSSEKVFLGVECGLSIGEKISCSKSNAGQLES